MSRAAGLYPKYKPEGEAWKVASLADHGAEAESLAGLEDFTILSTDLPAYRSRATSLFTHLHAHFKMEETVYFPAMCAAIPPAIQSNILGGLIRARETAPLHPSAAKAGPFNRLFHRLTGGQHAQAGGQPAQAGGQGTGQL